MNILPPLLMKRMSDSYETNCSGAGGRDRARPDLPLQVRFNNRNMIVLVWLFRQFRTSYTPS
jgi:hypothetical protein